MRTPAPRPRRTAPQVSWGGAQTPVSTPRSVQPGVLSVHLGVHATPGIHDLNPLPGWCHDGALSLRPRAPDMGPEPPFPLPLLCLSGIRLSDLCLCSSVSFSLLSESCCGHTHPVVTRRTPQGRPWAESPCGASHATHWHSRGRWLWGQAVLPQGALSLSLSVCVCTCVISLSLTSWGHRVKTCLCVCVLIKEGFLEGVRAGAPQRPESLSHRGSWYLGGGGGTRGAPNPLLSPRG